MRIIVMGGAGDVGSRVVEELAQTPDVAEVTVADRDRAGAERLVRKLSGARARVVAEVVDARDHAALVGAMRGKSVVASALGPFFAFEARLVAAALEARVPYASVCDEWDATEEVTRRFDRAAREAGVLVVSGLGTSPGFTNLGVRYLASELDRVERVDVQVYQPLDAGGGEAVMRHMLHIMSGRIAAWRGGARQEVRALSESALVEFPRFGRVRLWNMGHAEPVTLPRYFEGIEEVRFLMGYGRGSRLLVEPARLGLFRFRPIFDLTARGLALLERLTGGEAASGAVRLDVWGLQEGRPTHRMLCGIGQMREATGLSLAIGTLSVGRGQVTAQGGGVHAPEGCFDPKPFIAALAARGIVAYQDLEMTQPLR